MWGQHVIIAPYNFPPFSIRAAHKSDALASIAYMFELSFFPIESPLIFPICDFGALVRILHRYVYRWYSIFVCVNDRKFFCVFIEADLEYILSLFTMKCRYEYCVNNKFDRKTFSIILGKRRCMMTVLAFCFSFVY